ncbi:MAG: hypothetical protein ACERKN_18010 [Velocimicrobium sp.]
MKEKIRQVFDNNITLIEQTDKAVYYFREEKYDKALAYVADSVEGINVLVRAILDETEYFSKVEEASLISMIEGILLAKRMGDYVLLADLYELQLSNFLSEIQEMIIEKEEFSYSVEIYEQNLKKIEEIDSNLYKRLKEPEDARKLLEKGYAVEYSSCGLMTLAALQKGHKFYFHTNNHVIQEAFLLANKWAKKKAGIYHVYGLGLTYHIQELMKLSKEAEIYIYESDFNIIRLACNFVDLQDIFDNKRVHFIFDKTLEIMEKAVKNCSGDAYVAVHYPSYRNGKKDKTFLEPYIAGIHVLEDCECVI